MKWFSALSVTWKLIIVIAVIIILYLLYRAYNNRYVPAKDVQLPSDTQAGGITNWNPGQYTDAIFEDLDEVAGVHEAQPYTEALNLSNSQMVAIYNDWNQRYKSKFDNKDIIAAIEGEFTAWNYSWSTAAGNFATRMKTLVPNRR